MEILRKHGFSIATKAKTTKMQCEVMLNNSRYGLIGQVKDQIIKMYVSTQSPIPKEVTEHIITNQNPENEITIFMMGVVNASIANKREKI